MTASSPSSKAFWPVGIFGVTVLVFLVLGWSGRVSMTTSADGTARFGKPLIQTAVAPALADARETRGIKIYDALPLSFEMNQGQAGPRVRFVARGHRYSLLFNDSDVSFLLQHAAGVPASGGGLQDPEKTGKARRYVLGMKLLGSKPAAPAYGVKELSGKTNFFIGNDPRKWRTNIPNYARVRYAGVYPGVDLDFYGNMGRLEYDFHLNPGADPRVIAIRFQGSKEVSLSRAGDLVLETGAGKLVFQKPLAYQKRGGAKQIIPARFKMNGVRDVGFEIGPYDQAKALTIDPVLMFSTYFGGTGTDRGSSIIVDGTGNVFVAGRTTSTDFPVTLGAFQNSLAGLTDVFVAKLNSTGTALMFSTYIGGTGDDLVSHIAFDSDGNVVLTGTTNSTNFPVTSGVIQSSLKGLQNAFVTKLKSTGDGLVFSTYLGGTGVDLANSLALDSSGSIYLVGGTTSIDFPASVGQTTSGGSQDAFVAKMRSDGTGLVYATYLGGSGNDVGSGIGVDSSGAAYVAGSTNSDNFPTASPIQPTRAGLTDAFVTKLSADGSTLVYSTFLGGTGDDQASDLSLDSSGKAYVTGTTTSSDFRLANALQATFGGGTDGFVAVVDSAGSSLVYSTYLGGSGQDSPRAITVDGLGNAYLTGQTSSLNYPEVNPIQTPLLGTDAFVSIINPLGSALTFSSFLGGGGLESGNGIAIDSTGAIYLIGSSTSTDFPIILGDFQTSSGGGTDAFIAKILPENSPGVSLLTTSLSFSDQSVNTISSPQPVALRNVGSATLGITSISITGDFSQTNTCFTSVPGGSNCTINVTFTPTARGTRSGTLTISDDASGSPRTINLTGNGIAPTVTLSTTSLTFSDQNLGTTSPPQNVTLTNTGADPLAINGIAITGDFAESNDCGTSVRAGASCTLQVTFLPTKSLTRTGTLAITHNAPGSPSLVQLTGTGVGPDVMLSALNVTFSGQPIGTTSGTQTITLTNDGNAALIISQVTLSGDFAQTNNCNSPLAAQASCTFSVTFIPTTAGTTFGAITIADDAPGNPHVISLSGNGVSGQAPVTFLSPSSVSFGLQPVGTISAAQTVTVKNTGNASLTVSKVDLTGAFSQTNNCTIIAAGASCTVTLTFAPTLRGTQNGVLTITDNASGSPHTAAVSGTGTDFAMSAAPTIATVNAGGSAQFTLTITPLNGFNQTASLTCAGAPQAATCMITPSSVTFDSTEAVTATVTVNTTSRSGFSPPFAKGPSDIPLLPGGPSGRLWALLLVAFGLTSVGILSARRRRASWVFVAVVFSLVLWGACNVGTTITGTPPGSFPLTIKATTTVNGASLSHSINVGLTVN